MKRIRTLALTSAVAIAAGCGSDGSTAPNSSPAVDVAAVVSQMATGTAASYPGVQSATGAMPTSFVPITVNTTNCPYSPATQAFVCAPFTNSGITFTISYWLYDASGKALSSATGSIASIRTVTDEKGTLATTSGGSTVSGAITGHSDMTMSGLLTDHRTMNGTSTMHEDLTVTVGSTPTRSVVDLTQVTANLDVPTAIGPGVYPKSGTLTMDIKTSTDGAPSSANLTVHSVMTFNGTSTVTMTISINGVSSGSCTIDLAKGTSSCF